MIKYCCGGLSEVVRTIEKAIDDEIKIDCCEDLDTVSKKLTEQRQLMIELFQKKNRHEISQEYYNEQYAILSDKVKSLEREEQQIQNSISNRQIKIDKIKEMKRILNSSTPNELETMRKLVDKIKIIDKHHVEFQFVCGINVISQY